jgi:Response regulator containing CheY-like receiver, AAA-type ATPase, and DNA-binding domains
MSKRILVIEDTENNRRILNDLLTNAGFEVIEAVDGEKGVAMAAEQRPDLILMDIQLPIVDGYEPRVGSRRTRTCAIFPSSPSPRMRCPATTQRHLRWMRRYFASHSARA